MFSFFSFFIVPVRTRRAWVWLQLAQVLWGRFRQKFPSFPSEWWGCQRKAVFLRWWNSHRCLVSQVMRWGYILGCQSPAGLWSFWQDPGSLIFGKPLQNATGILAGYSDFVWFCNLFGFWFCSFRWRLNFSSPSASLKPGMVRFLSFFVSERRRKKVPSKNKCRFTFLGSSQRFVFGAFWHDPVKKKSGVYSSHQPLLRVDMALGFG